MPDQGDVQMRSLLFGIVGGASLAAGGLGVALYSTRLRRAKTPEARRKARNSLLSSLVTVYIGVDAIINGWNYDLGRRLRPATFAVITGRHLLREASRRHDRGGHTQSG